ncbi:coproporphyrinogen-III oxidase family protein [Streptomyces sp. NPDC056254]|uniref:coproporphyrinogen-III oxidase family protein n=1 Tax=Streptomyces sp. NPDC056254 TaxID=3345763 RepID=UPI0035D57554
MTSPRQQLTDRLTDQIADQIAQGVIPPYQYSYPPRSTYRPLPEGRWSIPEIWAADLAHHQVPELNLYLHVPFCDRKCGFCNLYTIISTDEDVFDAYTDALCTQIEDHAEIIQARRLRTVYIGGGTPALLKPRHFEQIFTTLARVYPNWRSTVEEVAVEATPSSIADAPDEFKALIDMGLTRANVGIQSLVPREIREAGRGGEDENVIRRAIRTAHELGLPDLSTDLIMGFAGQTPETWRHSVDELAALKPTTISTYFLTVRPDAWFSKTGAYQYMWQPELYDRYDYARQVFLDHGYVQEGSVRYKTPGRGGYVQKVLTFHGVPLLGLGVGARSYTSVLDYMTGSVKPSTAEVADYIRKAGRHEIVPVTGIELTAEEIVRKRLVLDCFDLDLGELDRFGYRKHAADFEPVLDAAEANGLLHRLGRRVQLTPKGFKYRDVLSWMFYSDTVKALDREYYENLHAANARARRNMGATPVRITGVDLGEGAA